MKQYQFDQNQLTLMVKKGPLVIRVFLFFLGFLFPLMPIAGLIARIIMGDGFHIAFFVGILFFGYLGFFMLKLALWNTCGKEIITKSNGLLEYEVDYGWFKRPRPSLNYDQLQISKNMVNDGKEQYGTLVFESEEEQIECATRLSLPELEELIQKLQEWIDK